MNGDRKSDRVAFQCEVEFRRHSDTRYVVDLLDLSPDGCCISPPVKVEVGDGFFLRIPQMEAIHAKAAWVEEWRVGAKFDRPIHPAVFADIVKRLKPSAS